MLRAVFAAAVFCALFATEAWAGDCPTGYEWDRRFVACVQIDCGTVADAHLSYTGNCVCGSSGSINENPNDPNRECARRADYESCPRCVYQCVGLKDRCPGEKPPQRECDEYCTSYHGPHAGATPVVGRCDCSCAAGYEHDETLLCVPTEATCDAECNAYHGTDRVHGEQASGTPVGVGCDCTCKPGYLPDQSLVCKPIPVEPELTCADVCAQEVGEGATGSGIVPSCACFCTNAYREVWKLRGGSFVTGCEKKTCLGGSTLVEDTGECVCPAGHHPKPFDDACIPISDQPNCGNGDCEGVVPYGDPAREDCRSCPQDCACKPGWGCDPDRTDDLRGEYGCHKAAATITNIACGEAMVTRKGGGTVRGTIGLELQAGDVVDFGRSLGCDRPFIELTWSGVRGRMYVGDDALIGRIEVRDDAVASGWPSKAGAAGKEVGWVLWEIVKTGLGPVMSFFTSSSSAASPDDMRVYVNSHLIVKQFATGATVYTLDGAPEVEVGGKRVTVTKGFKVTVTGATMSAPVEFAAYEPGDWYMRLPRCPPAHTPVGDECVSNAATGSRGATASASGSRTVVIAAAVGGALVLLLIVVLVVRRKRR